MVQKVMTFEEILDLLTASVFFTALRMDIDVLGPSATVSMWTYQCYIPMPFCPYGLGDPTHLCTSLQLDIKPSNLT
jgi:hypothetical protein